MATIPEIMAEGVRHHQAGRLPEAADRYAQVLRADPAHVDACFLYGAACQVLGHPQDALSAYEQVLRLKPDHAPALSNRGVILADHGYRDEAVASYRRALAVDPDMPDARNNLGVILLKLGRAGEAASHLRDALRLKPDYAEGHNNLGNALKDQGRWAEALACYRDALRLRPDYPEAHNNLGNALRRQGSPREAAASYRAAVRLRPGYAEAHANLADTLREQGDLPGALASYHHALRARPDFPEAHNNLGSTYNALGKPDEAVARFRHALSLQPDLHDAHVNLGNAFKDRGDLREAVSCYRAAFRARPESAEAHNNLGNALKEQGDLPGALACYADALRARPGYADAHMNLGIARLLTGDFPGGWPEYEWRWRTDAFPKVGPRQPLWDGSPLDGAPILLHAEQGLGDTLQFARYAPLVKARGGHVVLEGQAELRAVLAGCPGVDRLLSRGEPRPDFAAHAPLMSLPGILGTTVDNVPAAVPYLRADADRVRRWREDLGGPAGLRVGITWRGNARNLNDRNRSIPFPFLAPLTALPGVRVVSLQTGPGAGDVEGTAIPDLGGRLTDFADTAALLLALDLLITCDTAVAHLAGALAVPVWVALPFDPDWRWRLGRDDSPWYPTMRLFRQERPGDWGGVFDRVAGALRRLAAGTRGPGGQPARTGS